LRAFYLTSVLLICSLSAFGAAQANVVDVATLDDNTKNETKQAVSSSDGVDHKAQLKTLIKQMSSFKATFSQSVKDVDGALLMEGQGQVLLAHPAKLRWHAVTPDENLMVSDGKTLWIHNTDLEQVTIINAKDAIDSSPFALLTSDDNHLWQQYYVTKVAENYVIAPMQIQGQVKQLLVSLVEGRFSLLEIEDVSGQKSQFRFKDTQVNKPVDMTLFNFTLPDGVDVDDQRQ